MFYIASAIYGCVVRLRNRMYDCGLLRSRESSLRSVCVGNLAVGGTGKTPHAEYLLRNLAGRKAYVSRGYRRKSRGMVVADEQSTSRDLGDEAYQIHRKFKDVQVVVSGDRHKAVDYLKERGDVDIVILDDAFQHRNIRATVNVILTDWSSDPRHERMLPGGRMRDEFASIRRADVVVVTKCPYPVSEEEMRRKRESLNVSVPVLFSYMKYGEAYDIEGHEVKIDNEKVLLFTGIEKPEPLVEHLQSVAAEVRGIRFGDHHDFTASDIERIIKESRSCQHIVTTEKDYARLSANHDFMAKLTDRLLIIPIEVDFIGDNLISFIK